MGQRWQQLSGEEQHSSSLRRAGAEQEGRESTGADAGRLGPAPSRPPPSPTDGREAHVTGGDAKVSSGQRLPAASPRENAHWCFLSRNDNMITGASGHSRDRVKFPAETTLSFRATWILHC